jgi:predicted DNA-binding protein
MTDGNTYAINKHLDEREDYDALQEVTAELEQAEARIEELETGIKAELEYWMEDSAAAWDKCEENRLKLEKAIALAEEALEFNSDGNDCIEWSSIWGRIKELKGETNG